ncbi:troponin I [Rhodamnia argentea]|uniref:Troponin I n=1 Tax=Rhodamnia argentea TaxID=178133 RepID=A0A8B8QEI3_9MYRT|nr:troponin I [Rhodamnia argentea]
MATPRAIRRAATASSVNYLRRFCSSTAPATAATRQRQPPQDHKFLSPSPYVGSWETPKDPKEAEAKLAGLRREYAKQVKELRKEYIQEVEAMRLEQQRKDEAKREAIRVAREERNKVKAVEAKVRAEERMVAEEEFRRMLMKERAEKLENWRMKEKSREDKKKEARELLRRKSSIWIDESELESKILEAMVDTTTL